MMVHSASASTVMVRPFGWQSSFWHSHFMFGNVHLGTVWSAKLLIARVFTGQKEATPLRASGMT
jgi:hypothetical protein